MTLSLIKDAGNIHPTVLTQTVPFHVSIGFLTFFLAKREDKYSYRMLTVINTRKLIFEISNPRTSIVNACYSVYVYVY